MVRMVHWCVVDVWGVEGGGYLELFLLVAMVQPGVVELELDLVLSCVHRNQSRNIASSIHSDQRNQCPTFPHTRRLPVVHYI